MFYPIEFNSQRDNFSFGGKFKSWCQCFSTCAWMFLSYFVKEINAKDDKGLAAYLDDIEVTIGSTGIGEKIKAKYNWITGATSYWWLIQRDAIKHYLEKYGVKGDVLFIEQKVDFEFLPALLRKSPVILQTNKMGGLSNGHIILAVGEDGESIICHDPFGNALTAYSDEDGCFVKYPKEYLKRYTGDKIRCIFIEGA